MALTATKIASQTMGTDFVVSNTPVKIFNLYLCMYTTGAFRTVFDIEDADGNVIMTLSFSASKDTVEIEETWIANNGLIVKATDDNNVVIVMYSDEV